MRYSNKENEFIITSYELMSDKQMARILKRSEQGVKIHRERLGFTRSRKDAFNRFNKLNSLRIEMVGLKILIRKGILVDIANDRLESILDHVGRKFILPLRKNKVARHIKAKGYELHKQGFTNPEISAKLNVSRNAVWRWVKDINGYEGKTPITITLQSKINL